MSANTPSNAPLSAQAEALAELACGHCARQPETCVCAMLTPQATRHRVVVLQHPQEQDVAMGSVPLLTAGLRHCDVAVGLSWRNLADALGQDASPLRPWAVLYPASLPKIARNKLAVGSGGGETAVAVGRGVKAAGRVPHGAYLVNARGRELPVWPALGGIILLDGTWSQAKALWWRNPWLLKLPRLGFRAPPQSIYGRVRRAPKPGYLATVEAAAAALDALAEPSQATDALRRAFRTLVQRLRDQPTVKNKGAARPKDRRDRRERPARSKAAQSGAMAPSTAAVTQDV